MTPLPSTAEPDRELEPNTPDEYDTQLAGVLNELNSNSVGRTLWHLWCGDDGRANILGRVCPPTSRRRHA